MEEDFKDEYRSIEEEFKKISKVLWDERLLKHPAHYPLMNAANRITDILRAAKIADEDFVTWADWTVRYLDIYMADLPGELYHDYDKKNKRYVGKWLTQHNKLKGWISEFRTKFKAKIQ